MGPPDGSAAAAAAAADDIYEFKSSPEDNATMILQPPDVLGRSIGGGGEDAPAFHQPAGDFEADFGLDEEEDERAFLGGGTRRARAAALADEPMEAEAYDDDEPRPSRLYHTLPQHEAAGGEEGRKVPPLRILLMPKGGADEEKPPEAEGGGNAKKRTARRQTEKRATSSSRVTRSSTRHAARDSTPAEPDEPDEPPSKRPRPQRRATRQNRDVTPTATSSGGAARRGERESSQLPSTSGHTLQVAASTLLDSSMPASPADPNADEMSRSSGSDGDPAFSLQPERLSAPVRTLFKQGDVGGYCGLKKMLVQRWARDFHQQQQPWTPAEHKSALPPTKKKLAEQFARPPPPTRSGTSGELMQSHLKQQRHMRKRHDHERRQLSEFVEREFVRQLNNVPARSRTAVTCMRILADQDIYNANVLEINTDELNKIAIRSREEVHAQLRDKMDVLVKNTYNRHAMEAESLYYQQCYEWERYVFDQLPADKRARIEDFSLRDCVKRVKTKRIELAALLR
ncbi:hypothetical protein M3Y99_01345200 [Aphelenchoides fujianensis]|nr:hypothetical protein M3Y99_01345200 [Aphelenchoides fujianensis]